MAEPDLVATCVRAMRAAAPVPVTVKTRIGIDAQDSYDFLRRFVDAVAGAGCRTVILHARKAWLSGLSPKENRDAAPALRDGAPREADFPELEIIANGGIRTIEQARAQLAKVDGVMIGREVPRSLRARRVGARAAGHGGAGAQPVRRSSSACCRMSSASSPRARRWARSPGTFWGCSTACAARAPGAVICPKRTAPAPTPGWSWTRWQWYGGGTRRQGFAGGRRLRRRLADARGLRGGCRCRTTEIVRAMGDSLLRPAITAPRRSLRAGDRGSHKRGTIRPAVRGPLVRRGVGLELAEEALQTGEEA